MARHEHSTDLLFDEIFRVALIEASLDRVHAIEWRASEELLRGRMHRGRVVDAIKHCMENPIVIFRALHPARHANRVAAEIEEGRRPFALGDERFSRRCHERDDDLVMRMPAGDVASLNRGREVISTQEDDSTVERVVQAIVDSRAWLEQELVSRGAGASGKLDALQDHVEKRPKFE